MMLTVTILSILMLHMWVVVPLAGIDHGLSALAMASILGLCAWGNRRAGSGWGFQTDGIRRALLWSLAATLPVVMLLLVLGRELGTLRPRDDMALRFLGLAVWALVQQFILQTVILREARQRFSRRSALVVAAGLFALVHLPNPFLVPATFVAGLGWCWLYDRHPNLIPVALSHATASLAALVALGPGITGGMRVGYGYFLANGLWF